MRTLPAPSSVSTADWREIEKRLLALESLSKLTQQFACQPDFGRLMELLMLTVAGQFSIGSMFLILNDPIEAETGRLYFGTGRFRENNKLAEASRRVIREKLLNRVHDAAQLDDLGFSDDHESLQHLRQDHKVRLIIPLRHNNRFLGFVGLSEKLGGRPFSDSEQAILATLIGTVSPLIASSLLFLEVAHLNASHLEILNSVRQGVFVFEKGETLSKVNAAGLEILNLLTTVPRSVEELLGLRVDQVFPEPIFRSWGSLLSSKCRSEGSVPAERMAAGNGTVDRIFNVRISTISQGSALRTDLVITLDDVTAERDQESRLFELEKYAEQGVMASAIAHELNNHLGLISGGLELAQHSLATSDPAKAARFVEQLLGNVANMERFTSGLMDYAKRAPQKRRASFNHIISDVLAFATIQKRFRGIRIDTCLDRSLPDFEMDPDLITQLLLNLLNNAADAIAEAKRDPGEIVIRTARVDGGVEIRVSDDGAGMTPEVRSGLFQRRLTTKTKGHGYGLVTCGKIIENHGGSVTIESSPGAGSTFIIRFAVIADSAKAPVLAENSQGQHSDQGH